MRAQTCNQVVAKAIRKFGLAPVVASVEMAKELATDTPVKPKIVKTKAAPKSDTAASA